MKEASVAKKKSKSRITRTVLKAKVPEKSLWILFILCMMCVGLIVAFKKLGNTDIRSSAQIVDTNCPRDTESKTTEFVRSCAQIRSTDGITEQGLVEWRNSYRVVKNLVNRPSPGQKIPPDISRSFRCVQVPWKCSLSCAGRYSSQADIMACQRREKNLNATLRGYNPSQSVKPVPIVTKSPPVAPTYQAQPTQPVLFKTPPEEKVPPPGYWL